jgi:hypothetical protein
LISKIKIVEGIHPYSFVIDLEKTTYNMKSVIRSPLLRTNVLASAYCRASSSIPLKMRAAMVFKHGDTLKVQQEDVPKPKSGEVLIRVHRCGCCHTDIHAVYGDWPVLSRLPLCPGISYVSVIHS